MKSPIQVLLDCEQSEILSDCGTDVFVVIHRARRTEQPDINGRWIMSIVPCSISQANAAVRVARGISAERKTRTPKP